MDTKGVFERVRNNDKVLIKASEFIFEYFSGGGLINYGKHLSDDIQRSILEYNNIIIELTKEYNTELNEHNATMKEYSNLITENITLMKENAELKETLNDTLCIYRKGR